MITDFHIHVFSSEELTHHSFFPSGVRAEPETVLQVIRLAGVARAVVFGHPDQRVISSQRANDFVYAASEKFTQLIPFALIDHNVDFNIKRGFKGFKEHCYGQFRLRSWEDKTKFADSSFWKQQYLSIEKAELPLLIHLGPNGVMRLNSLLEIAPRLTIICAHIGWHFSGNIRPDKKYLNEMLRQFADVQNILFDTSALFTEEAELISLACDIVGPERLLFGSDYPTDGITSTMAMKTLDAAQLGPAAMKTILETNPQRVLKL